MSTMPAAMRGPLAIDPSVALAAFEWMPGPVATPDPRLSNGVLRIRVDGPLSTDTWWGTEYGDIQRPLREAAAGEYAGLRAIVLDIDSPGGTVTGIAETVAAIEAARKVTPVTAFVRGNCASAAYWLAAACDRIVTLHTAKAGCVGAVCTVIDFGGVAKKMGVEVYRFTSGRTPDKAPGPGSEAFNVETQRIIDAAGDAFLGDLARLRGPAGDLDAVALHYQRGAYLPAADALAAGWIDAVIPADASGPHAWLLTGEAPPESDDDEGGECPPCLPFPTVRGDAANTTEEAGMANPTGGGVVTLSASQHEELMALVQAKTQDAAKAERERDDLARQLTEAKTATNDLGARLVAVEAQAKAHADQLKAAADAQAKREVDDLIREGRALGKIGAGKEGNFRATAEKYGIDALRDKLADIPPESACPRTPLALVGTLPEKPEDKSAERERVAAEAEKLVADGVYVDFFEAARAVEAKRAGGAR